jgi:hypothetical protein
MLKRICHLVLLLVAVTIHPLDAGAAQVDEYELKTAYLYNFVLFTTWPAAWPPEASQNITICTIGDDQFGSAIEQLHGRKIRGKRLVVRRSIDLEQAPACHMLYIAESEQGKLAGILESLRGTSVLTISDALVESDSNAPAAGPSAANVHARCMITLILEDKRLMFEVDSTAIRQAGLAMSSRLLYLARRVY